MYRLRGFGSIQSDISAAASKYGVPPFLAVAVATRESGLNQGARGAAGEIGVFQLMPGTAAGLGVDPTDLGQNIDGGVRYLSQMYQQFGDWKTALEAYNAGPGNVSRGTVPSSSVSYADDILGAVGPDLTLPALDSSSQGDYSGSGDGSVPGLSALAWTGLGLAAAAVLFASLD